MDEAHSVSEWGHSFRPAYLALGAAVAQLGSPPVLALTATATQWVRGEIVERLGMRGPQILVRGTDRPNLFFEVQRVADSKVTVLFEKAGYKTLGLRLVQANGLLQPVQGPVRGAARAWNAWNESCPYARSEVAPARTCGREGSGGMRLKPVAEQVVVVVGASSGIGRETALRFARKGAKVVVSARSEQGLRSLVEEIRGAGGEATSVVADVAEFEQVQAIADRAVAEYGRIDTWVHNAAVLLHALFEDTTPEEFSRVIDVNLKGQAYGAMAALPYLRREGRGSLIHVSSIEARRAFPYHSAYSASKHGIDGFVEAMRVELRKSGDQINVAQVMPATINTPLFSKARTKIGVKPLGAPPLYQPGTVADVILYAAEHPSRDLISGGVGRQLLSMQKLSPRLMDALALRAGFRLQQTKESKGADAPDNLFQPIEGDDRVEGDFGRMAFRRSLYNWAETHPKTRRVALLGTAVGAVMALGGRSGGEGRR